MTGGRVALFLDRDGVLDEPVWDEQAAAFESPLDPDQVVLAPGAAAAIVAARRAGLVVVVVSNQPAAAKGNVSRSRLDAVHARVVELLEDAGAGPDASYLCLHHPAGTHPELGGPCSCRKPAPGLLTQAARDLDLDLARSWMIGDTDADVGAARAAGLAGVVVVAHPLSAHRRGPVADAADEVVPDVSTALRRVLSLRARRAVSTAGGPSKDDNSTA